MPGSKAGHLKVPEPCWTAGVQAGVMGRGGSWVGGDCSWEDPDPWGRAGGLRWDRWRALACCRPHPPHVACWDQVPPNVGGRAEAEATWLTILKSGTGIQGTAHTPSSQESQAPLGFTPFLLSPQSLPGGAFARMMDSASPWPPCLQPLSSLGLPRRLSETQTRGAHHVPGCAPARPATIPSHPLQAGVLRPFMGEVQDSKGWVTCPWPHRLGSQSRNSAPGDSSCVQSDLGRGPSGIKPLRPSSPGPATGPCSQPVCKTLRGWVSPSHSPALWSSTHMEPFLLHLSDLSCIQQFLAEDPTPSPKHQLVRQSASINGHLVHARAWHTSGHRSKYTEKQGAPPAAVLDVTGATCSSDGLGGGQGCIPPGLEAGHGLCSFIRE